MWFSPYDTKRKNQREARVPIKRHIREELALMESADGDAFTNADGTPNDDAWEQACYEATGKTYEQKLAYQKRKAQRQRNIQHGTEEVIADVDHQREQPS
jgi:hypothetical protein